MPSAFPCAYYQGCQTANFAAQRSGDVALQAQRAKHILTKNLAIAIWQSCLPPNCRCIDAAHKMPTVFVLGSRNGGPTVPSAKISLEHWAERNEATKRGEGEIPWTVVRRTFVQFSEGKFSLGAYSSSPHGLFELSLGRCPSVPKDIQFRAITILYWNCWLQKCKKEVLNMVYKMFTLYFGLRRHFVVCTCNIATKLGS